MIAQTGSALRTSRRTSNSVAGFSLLEVVLSLAILATSLAILGQLVGLGFRNARQAQDLTEAQMLAETLMEQIALEIIPPDPVTDVGVDMLSDPAALTEPVDSKWVYSIDWEPAPVDGLIMVVVTVRPTEVETTQQNLQFQLVRWIRDPLLVDEELPETSDGLPLESESAL